jgi:hypothetical protein
MRQIILLLLISQYLLCAEALGAKANFKGAYLENKERGVGSYITADYLLNNFYLYKKESIEAIEQNILIPKLKEFSAKLLQKVEDKNITNPKLLFYVATFAKLQDSNISLPSNVSEAVDKKIELINSASLANYKRFQNNERLSNSPAYYKALIFATQVPFYINESNITKIDSNSSLNNLKLALELSKIIKEDKELKKSYLEINTLLHKIFGYGDDLEIKNFFKFSKNISVEKLQQKLNKKRNYPKIIGESIDIKNRDIKDIYRSLLSFRLFSTAFTLDSYAYSRLVYPFTTTPYSAKVDPYLSIKSGQEVRALPSIEDIENIFTTQCREPYKNYFKNLKIVKKEFRKLLSKKSLHSLEFLIYKALIESKKLNAFRGFYTQNRYLVNAYTKKSYTPTTKGVSLLIREKGAFLEPKLTKVLSLMLKEIALLNRIYPNKSYDKYKTILIKLKKLSTKKRYSKKEEEFLNSLVLEFKGIIKSKFTKIDISLHIDSGSNRELRERVVGIKPVEYKSLMGYRYLHKEEIAELNKGNR